MKKAILPIIAIIVASTFAIGCKMAPSQNDSDTVAASVFEPAQIHQKITKSTVKDSTVQDSSNIFIIGEGSDKNNLQLISYPSRQDTTLYWKSKHIKVKGNADFGQIVRVGFMPINHGDSTVNIVTSVEEYNTEE